MEASSNSKTARFLANSSCLRVWNVSKFTIRSQFRSFRTQFCETRSTFFSHWNTGATIDASAAFVVSVKEDCVVCDFLDSQMHEVSLQTSEGTITLLEDELNTIFTEISAKHNDGTIIKKLPNSQSVEIHVLILSALNHSRTLTLNHQVLRGTSHIYSPKATPLWLGHRGCGMNASWKRSEGCEVENSLRGFQQARSRGLLGVEFDLQLTKDMEVVVFHDYEICMNEL